MGPEYESVSRFETDAALDDDNGGQAKKSKVDPPQSSNNPKSLQENGQISPQRDDHDNWSSPISGIMLQNMSPTQTPPVQVMERERSGDNSDYDPDRISSSASAASNDSLFSIGLGNRGTPQDDHNLKVHEDPLKFKKPLPAMKRKGDGKKSEADNKSESDGPQMGIPKENMDRNRVKFSPIEVSFAPAPVLRSDEGDLDAQDFIAPIKNSGCTMCSCNSCKVAVCCCTWQRCWCCSCRWPRSCFSCKWPRSCCSCKWPSCCSCKWPSCCSCKLSSCCCPYKWPSCSSCGWPSCPSCSLRCLKCPNFACGCPSCSSCSFMCCSWQSCKCSICSWPSVYCLKCEPKKLFCCFSKVSAEDQPKRASNKRSGCFSWSLFSCCRCC